MPIAASDIQYFYSGGPGSSTANDSLGGQISSSNTGSNIFSDISADDALTGYTDYRCVYVANLGASDLYNAVLEIASQVPAAIVDPNAPVGAMVEIGFDVTNERQIVTVTNFSNISAGDITLTYTDSDLGATNFTFNWNASVLTMASNFETAIQAVLNLEEVEVSGDYDAGSDTASFEVNFVGTAGQRYHDIMTLDSDTLVYSGTAPVISIIKSVDGGPINSTATTIAYPTTPPVDVTFSFAPLSVGTFRSFDLCPIWLKRTVPANTQGYENDGFTLRVQGTILP